MSCSGRASTEVLHSCKSLSCPSNLRRRCAKPLTRTPGPPVRNNRGEAPLSMTVDLPVLVWSEPGWAKGMCMQTGPKEMSGFQGMLERKQEELARSLRKRGDIVIEKSADQMDEIQYATERDL